MRMNSRTKTTRMTLAHSATELPSAGRAPSKLTSIFNQKCQAATSRCSATFLMRSLQAPSTDRSVVSITSEITQASKAFQCSKIRTQRVLEYAAEDPTVAPNLYGSSSWQTARAKASSNQTLGSTKSPCRHSSPPSPAKDLTPRAQDLSRSAGALTCLK